MNDKVVVISDKTTENDKSVVRRVVTEYDCWCCEEAGDWCKRECGGLCKKCQGTGKVRRIQTTTESKFLCLGGPHDGKVLTESKAGKSYIDYNRASNWKDSAQAPKVIRIHKSLLR